MRPFLLAAILLGLTVALVVFLDAQFPGVLGREDSHIALLSKLAILGALIASVAVSLRRERLGTLLGALIAWGAIGLVLVAGYSVRNELAPLWQRIAGNVLPSHAVNTAPGLVSLRATSSGHFHAMADVAVADKSNRVRFMVDTGASDVALTREDATRLGLDLKALRFDVPYSTANGPSMGARVRLDRIVIGDIAIDNVSGSVVSGRLDQSLLGMSFLRRLSGFEIRGEEMVLRR